MFAIFVPPTKNTMNKKNHKFFNLDGSIVLLISIILFVFVFPIIDDIMIHDFVMIASYTIMLLSIFSIVENKSRFLKIVVMIALLSNLTLFFINNDLVRVTSFVISIVAFISASIVLIRHIANSNNVNINIVIQAVSGYLLIGVIGVLLNGILLVYNEKAIDLHVINGPFSSVVYYTFVTLTTIGYGDIIPTSAIARSISILLGVTGQIYLTVIVAMIVGKYISSNVIRKN